MEGGGFNIHKKYSIVEKLSSFKSRLHTVYYKMLTWLLHTFTKSRSFLKTTITTNNLPLTTWDHRQRYSLWEQVSRVSIVYQVSIFLSLNMGLNIETHYAVVRYEE